MRVCVYVEGPSDRLAMQALLRELIARKAEEGVEIAFHEPTSGDRKHVLLTRYPSIAANILRDPGNHVVLLPDLYPRNKGFPHSTFAEMRRGIEQRFGEALKQRGLDDERTRERFRVFAFKHDLEALLLACPEALATRAGARSLGRTWRLPVEDQNQDLPPKMLVSAVFRQNGHAYRETVDAPMILSGQDYRQLARTCPQCFGPFVSYLEGLSDQAIVPK